MSARGERRSRLERAYALLLRAYPEHYRSRFAAAMTDTILRDYDRVRKAGRTALLVFVVLTIVQALWFGTGERVRSSWRMDARNPALRRDWSVATDIRYGLRLLGRSPLFTITSILSLAIGISAATVVFGIADALLVQPSPGVREPGRVVDIARTTNGTGFGTMAYPAFQHLRAHTRTLESMAATTLDPVPLNLSDDIASSKAFGRTVSTAFFDVLGVRPTLGRFFRTEEDDTRDAKPVVVLSYRLWKERFGSDPNVIARSVRLNRTVFTVIGRDGRPSVAIVNEQFARLAWPGRSAIGQRFWQTINGQGEGRSFDIVGVVKDARYRTVSESHRAFVYVPFAQHPQNRVELFVKHRAGVNIEKDVLSAIHRADRDLPVVLIQSFDEAVALGLFPQRIAAWIAGSAGAIGIVLAALGLYGVAAFLAAQRTREIAIRMALGASTRDIRSMVLGQAAVLGAAGTVLGTVLAWAFGRVVDGLHLLIGVASTDAITFGGTIVFMGMVLIAASYVPARRATSIDPAAVLRGE